MSLTVRKETDWRVLGSTDHPSVIIKKKLEYLSADACQGADLTHLRGR